MVVYVREFKDKDAPVLTRLLNDALSRSYQFVPFDESRLHSWIQDAELQVLIAEEMSEVLGSAAYVDGHWGEEIAWLAVRQSPNRRLIERSLVAEIEKYVKRGKVFTAVDSGSPKTNDWTELDYRVEGGLYHMIARLDDLRPLPITPQGILIRSLKPDEERTLLEAVNAGFGWERLKAGIIQEWKTDCPQFTEEWIHVAELEGRVVSVVCSRLDVSYQRDFGGKRGYLGPATTLPEFRGKKLAAALTRRAMNMFFEKGLDTAVLYTSEQNTASVALLKELGFEIAHNWKFMRKNVSPKG